MTPGSDDSLNYLEQASEGTLFDEYQQRVYTDEIEFEDIPLIASKQEVLQMIKELKEIYKNAAYDLEGAGGARKSIKKSASRFLPTVDRDENEPTDEGKSVRNPQFKGPRLKQRPPYDSHSDENDAWLDRHYQADKRAEKPQGRFRKAKTKVDEADPYGGGMFSPYDNEYSDNDINRAFDEVDDWISTEHIDADDPDQISDLKFGAERYLEQIGLGDTLSDEDIDGIIKRYYPASELSALKTDLGADPALKTQFGDDPQAVIQKYQKRDT